MICVAGAKMFPAYLEEGNRYGEDVFKGGEGVVPGVGAQLMGEAKFSFSQVVQVGFVVPHKGKYIYSIAEVSLHSAFFDS